jgi:hypothetical protein
VSTVYFGAVEVRNWLVPGQEAVLTYPSPAVKLTNGVTSYLHRDHLGSVRAITNAAGVRVESAVYKPFGEQTEFVTPGLAAPETKASRRVGETHVFLLKTRQSVGMPARVHPPFRWAMA